MQEVSADDWLYNSWSATLKTRRRDSDVGQLLSNGQNQQLMVEFHGISPPQSALKSSFSAVVHLISMAWECDQKVHQVHQNGAKHMPNHANMP